MKAFEDGPQKASELADAIMHDVAAGDARRRRVEQEHRPRDGTSRVAVVTLVVCCLVLTGLNLTGRMPFGATRVASVSDADRLTELRRTLNYAVREMEAYREAHGDWPARLDDLAPPTDIEWSYERLDGDEYRLVVATQGVAVAYDSAEDPDVAFQDVRTP